MAVAVKAPVNRPHFEGWHLIGAFPNNQPSGVGSWLLIDSGKALLLEIPPGLSVGALKSALEYTETSLLNVTASHDHKENLDPSAWEALRIAFPKVEFIHPSTVSGDRRLQVGCEPLWLIKAPKHSWTDVVTVFRGVAMIGDIELGMLESVNPVVYCKTKMESMEWLRGFQDRAGYQVHSVVSAHLNDVRRSINWRDLFHYSYWEKPQFGKRWQCRGYGCWGRLVPMKPDAAGRDMKCIDCGCPDWSNPRRR
jgi:hypothetical protein